MRCVETPDTEPDEHGCPVLVENDMSTTIWEPSEEDRARVAAGGRVGVVVALESGAYSPPLTVAIAAPYCSECGALMGWSKTLGAYSCTNHEVDPSDGLS